MGHARLHCNSRHEQREAAFFIKNVHDADIQICAFALADGEVGFNQIAFFSAAPISE
jgi:hypothetical protein